MELISNLIHPGGPAEPATAKVFQPLDLEVDLTEPKMFKTGVPHTDFARMRARAPVMWCKERAMDSGFWAITRYEDVVRVNTDPETFSSQRGGMLMSAPPGDQRHSPMWKANYNNFVNMDGARHLMLRREQMPFFTPKYLNALKDRIRAEIARLLDALPVEGECDFVEHFSQYLPVFTICEILGIPQADRSKFFGWLHYLELAFHWMSNDPPAPGTPEAAEAERFAQAFTESTAEMFAYGRDTLHKRRQSPKDDLMSAIALSKMDGEFLRDEYLDGAWLAIVFAGNDTTRNTITGSINLLTEFPDQKAKLIANPNLTANAVEEFLRLVSPIIYMRRTATKEVELHGQKIHEGEKVLMYYASANRDEAVFANPDRLDIARENAAKQIAFGVGPHVCMGRRLAQLQLELFHEQIWRRYPDLQYVGGMEVAANNFAHCINKLPVRYSAGRKAA